IELANGFHELCDATEQRARFERDLAQRRARGRSEPPLDERLLAALAAGLPDCSGVAVGFDRVVMAATGARGIDEVIAFPAERA
ncbi:MAG TPA: amino acid--tRNA ligase-related protein, partial [Steroidobacteraceae bacterium]|nr:amino acid--tRNA ligase-related protein [Steroidobacteraceae bacterium]